MILRYLRKLERERKIKEAGMFAAGTASGLAVGSLVALFTAKRSGKENRELVKDKAEHAKDTVEKEAKKVAKKLK